MKTKSRVMSILAPVIAIVIVVILWQLLCNGFHVSEKLFPKPSAIAQALVENFGTVIRPDLIISVKNIFIGYLIAVPIGFVIAAVCSQFRLITKAVTPVLIILMITPMSTLVPIVNNTV